MLISDDRTLRDIQLEFSEKFPFLKIEFFAFNDPPGDRKKLNPQHTIGEVRTIHTEGELSIHGNVKVRSLEDHFEEGFGLHVQVFRLSGNLWLQTTSTDEWTLHEQNRKGGASASHYKEKYEI
ncbi:MAG: hypothetical protein IPL49_19610 [Saprospirales bacterium]|nr:hypothetical protein [Saprospirales bacterium]